MHIVHSGTMVATLITGGANESPQSVSAVLLYFNDLIEKETSLPGCDFGRYRAQQSDSPSSHTPSMVAVDQESSTATTSFTRTRRGLAVPCVAAAVALDAGVSDLQPGQDLQLVGDVLQLSRRIL